MASAFAYKIKCHISYSSWYDERPGYVDSSVRL